MPIVLTLGFISFKPTCRAAEQLIPSEKQKMRILFICYMVIFSALCKADELPNSMKQEVEHLFAYLESSGCQFNRNGSWYSASEATVHIRKKYEYLLSRNLLKTTESFIEKAATKSSMSGKPYEVKCEGQSVVLNSVWFSKELSAYRKIKSH